MSAPRNWAIAGGGLLGMALAWELNRLGHRVTIFEASPEPGGLASAWEIGDIVWDRHYHVTLYSDLALRALLSELNLDSEMCWNQTRTGFYAHGTLHPFSGALDFARFPLLSPVEKLRFGLGILRASRVQDPGSLAGLSVEDWLCRLSGKAVFEKVWRPLLRCKLGDEYQSTAASFMWATIQRLYAARRSGLKQELFGYLPGGYARLLVAFVSALRARGVVFHLNAGVAQVVGVPDGSVEITTRNGDVERFDKAVLSVPAALAPAMCPQLTSRESEKLRAIDYHGVICTSLLLTKPLSNYYVTNIVDESICLTGVIEMSALVDRSEFGGQSLIYLPRYLRPDHPAFDQSDEEIAVESISALKRMHPKLNVGDIVACRTSRARHVFPRPTVTSSHSLPEVDTSIHGVHILNSAHITHGTLNVNETVLLAQQQARRMHALAA